MCLDTPQLNLGILLDVYFHCTQTTCGRVNYIQTLKGLIVIFHESLAFKQRVLYRLRITTTGTTGIMIATT